MSSNLHNSENPRKWRFTWEALSHIPTLRLFLFNPHIEPSGQCKNLRVDLNLEESLILVNWFEEVVKVSLKVPFPRVLVDVESPLSFKAFEDHIEVKLVLLLPVDHPIVSNFDSVLNLSEDESCRENVFSDVSRPFSMDSDLKSLSTGGGVHFYCKSCSTRLTRRSLRSFVEMPSVNWREVADNWFGACCCSFGGVSEKLVTRYANSYTCAEGTCLLNAASVILCKDDLVGCKFPDWDGSQEYESGLAFAGGDGLNEIVLDSTSNHGRVVCCENQSERMHDFNGKLSFMGLKKENVAANLECEVTEKEINDDSSFCTFSVVDLSENATSTPGCCVDRSNHVLSHDNEECTHVVSETPSRDQEPTRTADLLENQKSFLNGFLGNVFMARSSNLSNDVEWIEFACPQCSSVLGAYPCGNGYAPLDRGVRLFKCYISTCLPVGGSDDKFRKYTLERMFTNQLLESAKDELSFRTVVRDLKTRSPMLQIVLLNPNSWCCTGYSLATEDTTEPVLKIDLRPVIKVLFSDCRNGTESQLRLIEEWVTKNLADEVYMLTHQIKELIESLESAKNILPSSYAFLQGLPLSSLQR